MGLNQVLLELLDSKNLKFADVSGLSGMKWQSIKDAFEGKDTNSLRLINAISVLTETPITEILKRAGLKAYDPANAVKSESPDTNGSDKKPSPIKNVRYIPHPVQAGYLTGFADINNQYMDIHIPGFENLKDCVAFPVRNDSMSPLISSGDILVCTQLKDKSEIRFGNVYVVLYEEGIVVKRLMKGKTEDVISLHSDNHTYDPYDVKKELIKTLFVVHGFISQNTSPRVVFLNK